MRASDEPPITVVVHIPRAAGLTLRDIAYRQYPKRRIIRVPKLRGDPAAFYRGLTSEQRRDVHLIDDAPCVGAHECFERPVRYVALVRDPVERVLSWDTYRAAGRTNWGTFRIANKVRNNGQTRALAGVGTSRWNGTAPVTADTLARAKLNIQEHFAVIGTSERFDETMVVAKRSLGWREVSPQPRHVSSPRAHALGEPPEAVIEQIVADNAFDIELYEFVNGLLDDAIAAQGPDFWSEVEALKRGDATLDPATL